MCNYTADQAPKRRADAAERYPGSGDQKGYQGAVPFLGLLKRPLQTATERGKQCQPRQHLHHHRRQCAEQHGN